MTTERTHRVRPPAWDALDPEVQSAIVRVRELDARSREAADEARAASERVAEVLRGDEKRRSDAMASGEDDPGRDQRKIAAAEKAADDSAERARIASAAVVEAARRLNVVCADRAQPWADAARAQLEDRAADLTDAVENARTAYGAWIEARTQVGLATDERARRRGKTGAIDLPLDAHVDGGVVRVSAVLDALAGLVDGPVGQQSPAEDAQPLTDDDRRDLVADGFVIEGPGA